MRIVIGVLTCLPEFRRNYLQRTLRQLDANGANDCAAKFIFSDGEPPDGEYPLPLDWVLEEQIKVKDARQAFWNMLRYAVETQRADFLIYCEDDLLVSKNAVTRMIDHAKNCYKPEWGFITYFDRMVPQGSPEGFYDLKIRGQKYDSRYFTGTQCIMIPRRVIDFLLQHDPDIILAKWPTGKHNQDIALSYILDEFSPWKLYGAMVPGLIDHCGYKGKTLTPTGTNYADGPNRQPLP